MREGWFTSLSPTDASTATGFCASFDQKGRLTTRPCCGVAEGFEGVDLTGPFDWAAVDLTGTFFV